MYISGIISPYILLKYFLVFTIYLLLKNGFVNFLVWLSFRAHFFSMYKIKRIEEEKSLFKKEINRIGCLLSALIKQKNMINRNSMQKPWFYPRQKIRRQNWVQLDILNALPTPSVQSTSSQLNCHQTVIIPAYISQHLVVFYLLLLKGL